jgi:hypothetical protein
MRGCPNRRVGGSAAVARNATDQLRQEGCLEWTRKDRFTSVAFNDHDQPVVIVAVRLFEQPDHAVSIFLHGHVATRRPFRVFMLLRLLDDKKVWTPFHLRPAAKDRRLLLHEKERITLRQGGYMLPRQQKTGSRSVAGR